MAGPIEPIRWVDVEEAKGLSGLRLVLTTGVPGPWGESAKGVLHAKGIEFVAVPQAGGQPNEALRAWTGEINAPQAILDDEPPRTGWAEILFLAERLAPEPSLIPRDPRDRALMFGLCHELCGEQGFGWSRRLMLFAPIAALPAAHPVRTSLAAMMARYGYSEAGAATAPARAAEILGLLGEQLARQRSQGSRYLVGDRLSALDVYWAAFAALVDPLPEEQCAMSPPMRASYAARHPLMEAALDPALLAHRDFVYAEHLALPIDLGPTG